MFQSTFDKEKRREAERKAELERKRRVEVTCPFTLIHPPQDYTAMRLVILACCPAPSLPCA